jgi:hypothetical protein
MRGSLPVQAGLGKKENANSKATRAKWAGGVTQVAECLSSECKALISNSSTAKIKT